jgi:hypothetical protein
MRGLEGVSTMLAPRNRQTLLASLRPPEGFRVESALATTFTLDLTALLVAPLAFSLLGMAADRADAELDPYALLRAARDHSERMVVFCDATRVSVPAKYRALFVHLERCVVEVCAPHEQGVFHPKLWVLRFIGPEGAVRYRFLCASRNLTFDESWDTLLSLDGELTDRTNAIAMNRPLSDLVSALPGLARPGSGLSQERRSLVELMADELLRVRFEPPSGVNALAFHPLGIPGYTRFKRPDRIQKALVVSPFVDRRGLQPWSETDGEHVLVSRVDQLDALEREALDLFSSCHVLAADLDGDEGDLEVVEGTDNHSVPSGLHAKLYVVDDGWNAHVFTGSANATNAGFSRNVEVLVQLTGRKTDFGVDRLLADGLQEMVQPYARGAEAPMNAVERELEVRLCRLRRQLAEADWLATVGEGSPGGYPFTLSCEKATWSPNENIRVRPITLPAARERAVPSANRIAEFGHCSIEALTSFFAFSIALEQDGVALEAEFVLNARLAGCPADRDQRILASLFQGPTQVMHFLRLLLSNDPEELLANEAERATRDGAGMGSRVFQGALLERLLRALHGNPAQLDSVDRFIEELSGTQTGQPLVDPRFRQLWEPIYAARKALGGGTR